MPNDKGVSGCLKRSRSSGTSSQPENKNSRKDCESAVCLEDGQHYVASRNAFKRAYGTSGSKRRKNFKSTFIQPITVVHYPSTLPFPIILDKEFPGEPYRSRNNEVKSAVHWGQRKLILSEIQFFSLCAKPGTSYHVIYVGAAPGTHISFLAKLLEYKHSWELIDPGKFDREALDNRVKGKDSGITIRNEFFSNATAYSINTRRLGEKYPGLGALYLYETKSRGVSEKKPVIHDALQDEVGSADVARTTEAIPSMYESLLEIPRGLELLCLCGMKTCKPLLFISDIRTGNVKLPNYEEHVAENMRAQENWTRILQADFSLLKFRLPYTRTSQTFGGRNPVPQKKLIRPDGTVQYVRGDILLPIWTRPTSTEGRLIVPQGAFQVPYNVQKIEDQFFFFNSHVREHVHFNHPLTSSSLFDHHFDPSAEIQSLLTFLEWQYPELYPTWSLEQRKEKILEISASLSEHLQMDFDNAISRRDALMLRLARGHYCAEDVNETVKASEEKKKSGGTSSTREKDGWGFPEGTMEVGEISKNILSEVSNGTSFPIGNENGKVSEHYVHVKRMIKLAAQERDRPMWRVNVDEKRYSESSGFWITTRIPQ